MLKYTLLFLLLLFVTIGKADTFDNILKAIFYTENDISYLILHESMYHPTSGSYEQGNLRSQGYNSSRISVYNLNNGELVAQKDMGTIDSVSACLVLGCSPNNLWIFNEKYKSGLQSLKPTTLESGISQAKIYSKLNVSIGRFIDPDWRDISNYYDFDEIQQKLIVTNTAKKQYYVDAASFATEPINEALKLNETLDKYLDQSAFFKDSVWELEGYDEMYFKCGEFEQAKPTYLYGKFVLDQNKVRLFKHFFNIQEPLSSEKDKLSPHQNLIFEKSQENIKNILEGVKPDDVLLQTDANSFFVLSKSSPDPDAFLKISKIESKEFGQFNELWSFSPPGMFYNIAQARNTSKFKKYFGDIFPEFSYQFIQMKDDKLVIIFLLYVSCIDANTGKLLWQFKLK